ncbi:mCG140139, partial [Mus musculus]
DRTNPEVYLLRMVASHHVGFDALFWCVLRQLQCTHIHT